MPKESTDIIAFDVDLIERNRENGYQDLEEQRRAFCIEYTTNGYKHRDAAVSVGFSANIGICLKREPLVAAFIVDLQEKYLAESLVTKQSLDVYLDQLEDIAMGRVDIPIVTGAGEEIDVKKFHADLAMKVYAERAKLHGIVQDDTKTAAVYVSIDMGRMTGEVTPTIIVEGEQNE